MQELGERLAHEADDDTKHEILSQLDEMRAKWEALSDPVRYSAFMKVLFTQYFIVCNARYRQADGREALRVAHSHRQRRCAW